jgi:Holliday junction resolvase RusA-like endonuclease
MSNTFHAIFPVLPIPKGRPKFSMMCGFPRVYTPKRTADAEDELKTLMSQAWHDAPLAGPLKVWMYFWMPMPTSWSEKKRALQDGKPHIITPDVDNLIKLVGDSGNGILWIDDKQIYEMHALKQYRKEYGIEITMEW